MQKRLSKTNQISAGQIAFVLLAVLTAGKFFYLPSLLYSATGRDGWISGAVLTVINWLVLLIIWLLIKRSGEKSLGGLLSAAFGRVGAKVILLLLAAFLVLHLIMPVTEIYNYLNYVSGQKSNWIAFIIPLFCLVWFAANKGLTAIARNCELFAPFVFVAAIAVFAFSLPSANAENILPFGAGGAGNIFSAALSHSGWFSDCAVFLLLIGKSGAGSAAGSSGFRLRRAKSEKMGRMGLLLSSVGVSALIIAFFALFTSVFGAAAGSQNFALSRVSEYGPSNFLGHADRAAVTIWIFGSLLKILLFAWAAVECVSEAFPLSNKWARGGVTAGILLAAAALPVLLTVDFVLKDMFRTVWFLVPAGIFAVVLPVFLLIRGRGRAKPATTPQKEDTNNVA